MQAVSHCRRCGYANSFEWPACMGCGRDARRVLRPARREAPERNALDEVAAVGWIVPSASAALLAVAAFTGDGDQQSRLLLASAVVSTLAVAGTGFVARDALRWARSLPAGPAPPSSAPPGPPAAPVLPPRREWHVSDDDLRSVLDSW